MLYADDIVFIFNVYFLRHGREISYFHGEMLWKKSNSISFNNFDLIILIFNLVFEVFVPTSKLIQGDIWSYRI